MKRVLDFNASVTTEGSASVRLTGFIVAAHFPPEGSESVPRRCARTATTSTHRLDTLWTDSRLWRSRVQYSFVVILDVTAVRARLTSRKYSRNCVRPRVCSTAASTGAVVSTRRAALCLSLAGLTYFPAPRVNVFCCRCIQCAKRGPALRNTCRSGTVFA